MIFLFQDKSELNLKIIVKGRLDQNLNTVWVQTLPGMWYQFKNQDVDYLKNPARFDSPKVLTEEELLVELL